jgi:hypothetical protein
MGKYLAPVPHPPTHAAALSCLLLLLAWLQHRLNDRIVEESCLPYTVAPGKDAAASLCRYRCNKPAAVWTKGRYEVVSLSDSIPLIQFFIRRYGAVITRLNIFSDFRPFFKANPKGIYDGRGCSDGRLRMTSKTVSAAAALACLDYCRTCKTPAAIASASRGCSMSSQLRQQAAHHCMLNQHQGDSCC